MDGPRQRQPKWSDSGKLQSHDYKERERRKEWRVTEERRVKTRKEVHEIKLFNCSVNNAILELKDPGKQ